MIYIEKNSMDPCFWFALEYYLMKEKDLGDEVFLFWRTEPTLMIGVNQITTAEINESYASKKNIHIVRRVSGGGTIYTDPGSWQFSYIVKNQPVAAIDFKRFVLPVLNALDTLGIKAYLSGRNDLMIDGRKFCGNAQYWSQNSVLHHGSILFDTDLEELVKSITVTDDKIISKGIQSIRQRVTNLSGYFDRKMSALEFKEQMLGAILHDTDAKYTLTEGDLERINQIALEKFGSWEWNYGKAPKFQVVKSRRFDGGKVEICLNLEHGLIRDCKIYGDFFFSGDVQTLIDGLVGCLYKEESVREALTQAIKQQSFYEISIDDLVSCII